MKTTKPREEFSKIARRAAKRWGKILTGKKLEPEDISHFRVMETYSDTDAIYYYDAQRNRAGTWDLLFYESGFIGRENEQVVLAGATLEQVLDYLYRAEPPHEKPGFFTPPSDLARIAAMIGYIPPEDARSERAGERAAIKAQRESGLAKRAESIQELKKTLGV